MFCKAGSPAGRIEMTRPKPQSEMRQSRLSKQADALKSGDVVTGGRAHRQEKIVGVEEPPAARPHRETKRLADLESGQLVIGGRASRREMKDLPPYQPAEPVVLRATVVEYSHVRGAGTVQAVVDGKTVRLMVNAKHLRDAGYGTLTPGHIISAQVGCLVVDTLRVTAILPADGSKLRQPPNWLMRS